MKKVTRKLKISREIIRDKLSEVSGGDARNSTHPSQCCVVSVPASSSSNNNL